MKKLLCVALLSLFFLVGCGGDDQDVVCTMEGDVVTIHVEDGEVAGVTFEIVEDISNVSDAELEILTSLLDAMDSEYEITDDRLIATMIVHEEQLPLLGISRNLDAAVEQFVADGASCN